MSFLRFLGNGKKIFIEIFYNVFRIIIFLFFIITLVFFQTLSIFD